MYIGLLPDGRYYVGMTGATVAVRLKRHQEGKGGRFTRRHPPEKILWKEAQPDAATAAKRERQLKGWSHAKKDALIAGDWALLRELSRSRNR